MYQKTPFFDNSLIKTLANFMTVKYNPSLISFNNGHIHQYQKVAPIYHFILKKI